MPSDFLTHRVETQQPNIPINGKSKSSSGKRQPVRTASLDVAPFESVMPVATGLNMSGRGAMPIAALLLTAAVTSSLIPKVDDPQVYQAASADTQLVPMWQERLGQHQPIATQSAVPSESKYPWVIEGKLTGLDFSKKSLTKLNQDMIPKDTAISCAVIAEYDIMTGEVDVDEIGLLISPDGKLVPALEQHPDINEAIMRACRDKVGYTDDKTRAIGLEGVDEVRVIGIGDCTFAKAKGSRKISSVAAKPREDGGRDYRETTLPDGCGYGKLRDFLGDYAILIFKFTPGLVKELDFTVPDKAPISTESKTQGREI